MQELLPLACSVNMQLNVNHATELFFEKGWNDDLQSLINDLSSQGIKAEDSLSFHGTKKRMALAEIMKLDRHWQSIADYLRSLRSKIPWF